MRLNNQVKVGLTTVICLVAQGYVFTYMLNVNPSLIFSVAPLLVYIIYIYARGRQVWYFNKPLYWITAVLLVTIIDLAPYVLAHYKYI